MKKKILIVAYYFPPMGGSGVQRPLKFAKYLKKYGWEPVVIAPEPGLYHTFDDSLVSEMKVASIRVERVPNHSLFFKSRKKKQKRLPKSRFTSAIIKSITSWFFLPDNKKGWIDDAVKKCVQIINKETIHAVYATAPPYSNLIAAKKLKDRTAIPVIMDLRDDWLESHLIHYPTKWHFNKMREIERETLTSADHITVVNEYYRQKIDARLGAESPPITTIPNGFDKENFDNVVPAGNPDTFSILYSGLFYGSRKPDWFLKSVRRVMDRNTEFKNAIEVQFQGGLDNSHWKVINQLKLSDIVVDFGYVNHQNAVHNLSNADVLFLTLGRRDYIEAVTPGKVFEYIGSLKPILAFIPEGITSDLLEKYGASHVVGISDVEAGANAIEDFFYLWKKNDLPLGNPGFSKQFERSHTAGILSEVLQKVTEENVQYNR